MLALLLASPAAAAGTYDRAAWREWRSEKEERARDGERSFLNLQDAVWVKSRKKVWLEAGREPVSLKFLRKPPRKELLGIFFDGKRALLSQGTTTFDLLDKEKWMIPGGLRLNALVSEGDLRVYLRNPKAAKVVAFERFEFFGFDPAAVVEARFVPRREPKRHVFSTSTGRESSGWLLGRVRFSYAGRRLSMKAYTFEDEAEDSDYLFMPFLDQTSRDESYGAGRYLEADIADVGEEAEVVLDFNRAYNPLCARSKFYSCPRVPDKPLPVAIRAGEKRPLDH
jgi:uncharacterized protein (DUF1684 family)